MIEHPKMNRPTDGAGRIVDGEEKIYFDKPDGLELDGDSGEVLMRWKKDGDRYCIVSMDGVPIGSASEEDESSEPADTNDDEESSATENEGASEPTGSGY